jgi:hypothetical protein
MARGEEPKEGLGPNLLLQKPIKAVSPPAADRELSISRQDDQVAAPVTALDLLDLLYVQDRRAVDANEAGWIELFLEILHGFPEGVGPVSAIDPHIVAEGVDPVNLIYVEQKEAAIELDLEALNIRLGSIGVLRSSRVVFLL